MQKGESVQTPQNVFNIYYGVKYVKESKGVRRVWCMVGPPLEVWVGLWSVWGW